MYDEGRSRSTGVRRSRSSTCTSRTPASWASPESTWLIPGKIRYITPASRASSTTLRVASPPAAGMVIKISSIWRSRTTSGRSSTPPRIRVEAIVSPIVAGSSSKNPTSSIDVSGRRRISRPMRVPALPAPTRSTWRGVAPSLVPWCRHLPSARSRVMTRMPANPSRPSTPSIRGIVRGKPSACVYQTRPIENSTAVPTTTAATMRSRSSVVTRRQTWRWSPKPNTIASLIGIPAIAYRTIKDVRSIHRLGTRSGKATSAATVQAATSAAIFRRSLFWPSRRMAGMLMGGRCSSVGHDPLSCIGRRSPPLARASGTACVDLGNHGVASDGITRGLVHASSDRDRRR